jgi:uncharacterized hydrophobic protein (TIGR00271 family)
MSTTNNPVSEDQEFEKTKLTTLQSLKKFFKELLNIRKESDRDATIEAVKEDISFKGHTAWILIFSVFVASIGLNISSTAVVIGAMLISPLMGPIVGTGLAIAINDVDTLRRSLVNLLIMVSLSVLTAYFYFSISPLTKETPELISRTYPTILDVLIAIFGGLALIVAKTKKGTIASVIFGVAIATALMPPLCTVGYGLAVGNLHYAGGALYLFSINTVFIALTTFVVAKALGFPLVRYANSKLRRRIARTATFIALVVMIPSVVLFINLLKKEVFKNKAEVFVTQELKAEGAEVVKATYDFDAKKIDVYLIGKPVPQSVISSWETKMKDQPELAAVKLTIFQGVDQSDEFAKKLSKEVKAGILEELYVKNEQLLKTKEQQINFLENELVKLKIHEIDFKELSQEVKILFPEITSLSYSKKIVTDFKKTDTLTVFSVKWEPKIPSEIKRKQKLQLDNWLKVKFKLDTLVVE